MIRRWFRILTPSNAPRRWIADPCGRQRQSNSGRSGSKMPSLMRWNTFAARDAEASPLRLTRKSAEASIRTTEPFRDQGRRAAAWKPTVNSWCVSRQSLDLHDRGAGQRVKSARGNPGFANGTSGCCIDWRKLFRDFDRRSHLQAAVVRETTRPDRWLPGYRRLPRWRIVGKPWIEQERRTTRATNQTIQRTALPPIAAFRTYYPIPFGTHRGRGN